MAKHTFYEPEVLDHLHKVEMIIMKDIDYICRKYKLTYFGFCGTGIGALRHQGFIPWDDDIDLAMPRRDFERFKKLLMKEFPDKYHLLEAGKVEHYPLSNMRVCLNGTTFLENVMVGVDCDWGIFVDIYPLENAADNPIMFKWQMWSAWFWGKLLILKEIPRPYLYIDGFLAKLVTAACVCTNFCMNKLGITFNWLLRKREHANRKYAKKDTKRWAFFCDPRPDNNIFVKEDIFPLKYYKFEDIEMPFPNNIDELLTKMFGDYMTMPPVEKRKTHYPHTLDFGKYDKL